MTAQCCAVAGHDQFFPCSCHGNVGSPDITKKTNFCFVIASNKADGNDVALLALKSIDSIDGDEFVKRFEKSRRFCKFVEYVNL